MSTSVDLIALLGLVLACAAVIFVAISWPRFLADALWQFLIAPRLVSSVSLATLVAIAILEHVLVGLSAVHPLGFSIELILTPFAIVPLSDAIAYALARRRGEDFASGWRHFIFEACLQQQHKAYEAPRSDQ